MLPKDPNMLLSYVNMQLRDREITLEDLCAECGVEKADIEERIAGTGCVYREDLRRFCPKEVPGPGRGI